VQVLIFHGYLLSGTGSNVYNARLAEALVRAGHEVHLLCQDRHADELPFVDAIGDWDDGPLQVRTRRAPARCTVYRPHIGTLLPVYVADRYEGLEARPFPDCSEQEIATYVDANVAAVAEVAGIARPAAALANHLVMGPLILARALADAATPYAVKVHGSALEYTVKPHPDRFLGAAREGLASARGILVGSRHTAQSLWQTIQDPAIVKRTRMGPPGVDVQRFAPREPAHAAAALRELAGRLGSAAKPGTTRPAADGQDAFARDPVAAGRALERLDPPDDQLVVFVGKLIVSKGADLLAAAWPLVLDAVPAARLVVVGFGAFRAALERLLAALAAGDLQEARAIAGAGRSLEGLPAGAGEGGPPAPLRLLLAFLDSLEGGERDRYLQAARALGERVVLTGRLEHEELADLLPAAQALVVPSTFPEAFGMVAAEAAACGVLPLSAEHSGLSEVSAALAARVPPAVAPWLSFPLDGDPVRGIAERLVAWLRAEESVRAQARRALVATARERWSWEGVATTVLAAAMGELEGLPAPAPTP
jgi:glycosyltransferase involved in cell wall biosynthesis